MGPTVAVVAHSKDTRQLRFSVCLEVPLGMGIFVWALSGVLNELMSAKERQDLNVEKLTKQIITMRLRLNKSCICCLCPALPVPCRAVPGIPPPLLCRPSRPFGSPLRSTSSPPPRTSPALDLPRYWLFSNS